VKRRYEPSARREAAGALQWYLRAAGPRAALAFDIELDAAVTLALQQPGIGTPGVQGSRSLRLERFPYTLHYRVDGDLLVILAVAHQRRKPGYWL
jgi:toxin ParE1/3/4